MTTRREFVLGAVSAAVSAALPATPEWEHRAYGESFMVSLHPLQMEVGQRYAEMLAHSLRQTMEQTAANVLGRAFGDEDG